MSQVEERLSALDLVVPTVPAPVAAYVPAVRTGSYVFTSGQLPLRDGQLLLTGKVGGEVSAEEAYDCARQCALNAIAASALSAQDRAAALASASETSAPTLPDSSRATCPDV